MKPNCQCQICSIFRKYNINAIVKGFLCRKHLCKMKDNIDQGIIYKLLHQYIKNNLIKTDINKTLSSRKMRQDNFPSEISENIVKFAIFKKYKIMPTWDVKSGDLQINIQSFQIIIEVKGFSSTGPTSFGPKEKWDYIYFVDATDFKRSMFKVYEVKISNNNEIWRNIKVNKDETFKDQCKQKRRPRLCFNSIKSQLDKNCTLIFNGNIIQLFSKN